MDKKKTPLEILASSKFVHTLLSIIIGFAVGALFLVIMGLSVGQAYGKLLQSIFSSIKSISYCIVYATPYIATGLSVAFSFKTGVFNIGAEGQFVVGSMSACVVGILLGGLPAYVLIPLCFLAAALAGALWGTIVGILKTRWGINEVLSMIMFNWIAFFLSNYIAGFPAIHSEGNAEATRNISENARILFSKDFISRMNLCPTANWGILVAIVLAIIVYFIIEKTTLGYELKAVGFNKSAAEYGGINVNRSILTALAISGALWGTIVGFLKTKWGINEVLSMIMFNWIAFYLSNFIAGIPAIHSDGTAEATKNISANASTLLSKDFISQYKLCPTANWGILVAIVLTVVVYIIIEKTTLGYELKAVGFNKNAAEYGGINVNRSILTSLAISGALAGIGGALLLLGMGGRISVFSSQEGYGFAGIVVALIGVTNPFGVFVAGLFYGAMTYGGSKLNLVGAPTQVVSIIMGTIVFFIAISSIFSYLKNLKKDKPVTPVKPVESGKEDDPE